MVAEALITVPREVYLILSAGLGGVLSIGGSYLLQSHQHNMEKNHLKTALATEIKTIHTSLLKTATSSPDEIDRESFNELTSEDPAEMDEEKMERLFEMYHRGYVLGKTYRYKTMSPKRDVYTENLDKIGTLNERQIESLIHFYDQLEVVSSHVERVSKASSVESSEETILDYQDEINNLQREVRLLESWKMKALQALGELDESKLDEIDDDLRSLNDDSEESTECSV